MADSRISRLSQLMESRNRVLRSEAATQLAQFPITNSGLIQVLQKQLQSHIWETRSAAADALGGLLEKLSSDLNINTPDYGTYNPTCLESVNVKDIIEQFNFLVSCEETCITTKTDTKLSKKEQRRLVDHHLDLNARTGVSSHNFLADEDLAQDMASSPRPEDTKLNLNLIKCKLNPPSSSHKSCTKCEKSEQGSDENIKNVKEEPDNSKQFELEEEDVFYQFLGQVLTDLSSQRWQQRHGNALALCKTIQHGFTLLTPEALEQIAVRLIQVLALDRFNDFVTGSSAVAPVREAVGQCLSMLMLKVGVGTQLVLHLIRPLRQLLSLKQENAWQCRQAALIVLKYYFSMCESGEHFFALFGHVVKAMSDKMDEVVSVAVHTLSSLFNNHRIDQQRKREHIDVVMRTVWNMLLDSAGDVMIADGVCSLLVDLLSIVQTWLVVVEEAQLNVDQFAHITQLIDPSQVTSTVKAMECIGLALNKKMDFDGKLVFQLLKMLYRCLLFVQPSESQKVIDLVFATLMKVVVSLDEKTLASVSELQNSIGYWVGCLTYDLKNAEIDVFIHNVNGQKSTVNSPREILCGDELRFLEEKTKHNAFMNRKCLAARFLSPLVDVLYRSDLLIQDQPLHLSLQLHFIPYLRSSSLYQRMGVALVLNCWARMFRRAFNAQKPQQYPTLVVAELERVLMEAPHRAPYDEPATMIRSLTSECSEFRRHCLQKGVPAEECPSLDAPVNVEAAIHTMYDKCRQRLQKPQDVDALEGRHKYLVQLVEATRLQILTNNNRLNAICASALFYFGHVPVQMTPLIKPLVGACNTEDNELVAEECFFDSFPILFSVTLQRNPCPHVKVLKQLATGLMECGQFMATEAQTQDVDLVSAANPPLAPVHTRSKNCQLIIRKLAEQLEALSFQVCPTLKDYLRLDQSLDEEEQINTYLVNLEFLRILVGPTAHRPSVDELARLRLALAHSSKVVRFRTARCLAEIASSDMGFFLNHFYFTLADYLDEIESTEKRAGAVECLALVVGRLDAHLLIAAASLLAPLALKCVADSVEAIRKLASLAFGKLVALLHLESLTPELQAQLEKSKDFVHVLSQPSLLPTVRQDQIPNLNSDVQLRGYQLEGITWLRFLCQFGLNGILADDMGLGKTVQTLSVLAIHSRTEPIHPSLIVCPRTLTNHWCNEWTRYFPKANPMHRVDVNVAELPNTCDVVVVSYEELRTNFKRLNNFSWKYLVLDEGHCIRNPNTQMFEAIESIKAKHKLLLSGTPVQNSPADLWALFKFLMPGYLSSKSSFQQRFLRPILSCRNPKASEDQTKQGEEALKQLHRLILPFVLRRLKTDVLKELPDKVVQDWVCQLTDTQRMLYQAVADKCSLLKKEDENECEKKRRLSPLHTLIALRQLVDHPILIRDVLRKIEFPMDKFNPQTENAMCMEHSGKMMALREILQECQIGDQGTSGGLFEAEASTSAEGSEALPALGQHRALVFCQWRASVELVARFLEDGSLGQSVRYLRLDGTVAPNERQAVVDAFNHDPSIDLLLVTTHIGGVGLTLTGADVVIFLDHDWNPVKDLQAVDRAHRLGQTKTVQVFRLITQGSIEEKIMQYQKFKTDTANALVGADNRSISSMATDELLELFNLTDTASSSNSGPNSRAPPSKRRKKTIPNDLAAANPEEWSVEQLWDSSQYEDQHSVQEFMKNAQ